MGIDHDLLLTHCTKTLERTDLEELGTRVEGKVRDAYVHDGRRLLITTDRISCFDVVVGTIPFKGQVLNELAAFWFDRVTGLVPHQLSPVAINRTSSMAKPSSTCAASSCSVGMVVPRRAIVCLSLESVT